VFINGKINNVITNHNGTQKYFPHITYSFILFILLSLLHFQPIFSYRCFKWANEISYETHSVFVTLQRQVSNSGLQLVCYGVRYFCAVHRMLVSSGYNSVFRRIRCLILNGLYWLLFMLFLSPSFKMLQYFASLLIHCSDTHPTIWRWVTDAIETAYLNTSSTIQPKHPKR
jgi:hypothetical protein